MNARNVGLLSLAGLLVALSGGCGSKDPAPDPAAGAKTNAAQAQAIDQNPNIPPQAKAALEQSVQGKNVAQMPRQAPK